VQARDGRWHGIRIKRDFIPYRPEMPLHGIRIERDLIPCRPGMAAGTGSGVLSDIDNSG